MFCVVYKIGPTEKPAGVFIESPKSVFTKGENAGGRPKKGGGGEKRSSFVLCSREERSWTTSVCVVTILSNLLYVARI